VGRDHFSSMGCDSTGNTKLCRELGHTDVPTIFIIPDPNHHLSLMIKDICKIEYFLDGIEKMRTTITYFSHSSYSMTHLRALQIIYDINKGFEAIGKTRFGTLYWAGYASLRSISLIKELIDLGIIDVNGSDKVHPGSFCSSFMTSPSSHFSSRCLVSILEPIAHAIKCLEGLNATASDIWKFYVPITAVLHNLFTEDILSILQEVCDEVSAIVNQQYDQMINGPSGDLFLSGFFFDP
ncbi:hypothetical protein B0H10DRAFT_1716115, partial [Mycena sp. CBHHK59/15]